MSAPSVRASAVRQLADTSRDLLDDAKALLKKAEAAPDGSAEKTALKEEAQRALEKAKAIAKSAIKLAS